VKSALALLACSFSQVSTRTALCVVGSLVPQEEVLLMGVVALATTARLLTLPPDYPDEYTDWVLLIGASIVQVRWLPGAVSLSIPTIATVLRSSRVGMNSVLPSAAQHRVLAWVVGMLLSYLTDRSFRCVSSWGLPRTLIGLGESSPPRTQIDKRPHGTGWVSG
jgi:hypothetical protein